MPKKEVFIEETESFIIYYEDEPYDDLPGVCRKLIDMIRGFNVVIVAHMKESALFDNDYNDSSFDELLHLKNLSIGDINKLIIETAGRITTIPACFTNLVELKVYNAYRLINILCNLNDVKTLHISGDRDNTLNLDIKSLESVERARFSDINMTEFPNLPMVRTLSIRDSISLEDLWKLPTFENLELIYLETRELDLTPIAQCKKLKRLWIPSECDLWPLVDSTSIQIIHFDWSDNEIDFEPLIYIPTLTTIYIYEITYLLNNSDLTKKVFNVLETYDVKIIEPITGDFVVKEVGDYDGRCPFEERRVLHEYYRDNAIDCYFPFPLWDDSLGKDYVLECKKGNRRKNKKKSKLCKK